MPRLLLRQSPLILGDFSLLKEELPLDLFGPGLLVLAPVPLALLCPLSHELLIISQVLHGAHPFLLLDALEHIGLRETVIISLFFKVYFCQFKFEQFLLHMLQRLVPMLKGGPVDSMALVSLWKALGQLSHHLDPFVD